MINYPYLRRFATMVAQGSRMAVNIDMRHKVPHTDGRNINMPLMPEDGTKEFYWWWYAFIHECEHNRGDNRLDFELTKTLNINMRSPFGYVLNVVEDHNIERKAFGEYGGKDDYLTIGRDIHYSNDKWEQPTKELAIKLGAVWVFDWLMRTHWQPITHTYPITGKIKVYVDKLMVLKDEYRAKRKGGEPNVELTKKIWDILDVKGDGDESKGEGEGGGEGRMQQAQSDGLSDELKELLKQAAERLPHDHAESKEGAYDGVPIGSDDVEKSTSTDAYQPVDIQTISLTDGEEACTHSHLSHKVATLLRVHAQKKWESNKPRGKINRRALYKLPQGHDKVFRTPHIKDILDTTVTLFVDGSGSMSGAKYEAAKDATAQMVSCLSAVGIPHEVLVFTQDRANMLYVASDYNELPTPEQVKGRMSKVSMGCNLDGDCLLEAHHRLLGRKQKRKVLIVLSDGQPSGTCKGNPSTHLKDVAASIEKARRVELYAVGVLTEAPKEYYSNYELLSNPNDIEATVLSLIKKSLIK
jgi:hypothetical protein